MSIRITITDEEFQVVKTDADGNVSENLTWETPEGLPDEGNKGDIMVRTATGWQQFNVGANDQVLTADSTTATGVKWGVGGGGGGGTPSDTVEDVTYGEPGDAGVSDEYSRGDHVHSYNPPNCLKFPSSAEGGPTHVDHGAIFTAGAALGDFWFECWVAWDSGQYVISEGPGGDHAILYGWGVTGKPSGNFWDNVSGVLFGGDDTVAPGEWHHLAVGWKKTGVAPKSWIECYINGVPCGLVSYSGLRYAGDGTVTYIGGSDHSNYYGKIAALRLVEGYCPTQKYSFRPDRFFGPRFGNDNLYDGTAVILQADYTKPQSIIADIKPATGGRKPGRLANANVIDGLGLPLFEAPTPYWVYDPKCPVTPGTPPLTTEWGATVLTPTTPPVGCRIFDSFRSRGDQTRCTEADNFVGIGSTEGGSLGPLVWQAPDAWGCFRGNAIWLGLSGVTSTKVWVENGVADMDVSVTRRPQGGGGWATGDVGLVLRLVDASNYVYCVYYPSYLGGDGKIYLVTVVAGVVTTTIVSAATPSSATFGTLRCKVKTVTGVSTWTIYTDGVQVGTGTDETFVSATKVGMIYQYFGTSANANGHGRMTNFTVAATP